MNIPYQMIDAVQAFGLIFAIFIGLIILACIPALVERYKSLRLHKSLRKLTKYSPRHGH